METRRETVKGKDMLFIAIPLQQPHASASGKSQILFSTNGNKDLAAIPGAKIGINIYKPNR